MTRDTHAWCEVCKAPPAAPCYSWCRQPIDMVLHCPACGLQHIDAPGFADDKGPQAAIAISLASRGEDAWLNPPHRSHLCHRCGHIWRPADVPTNGVAAVKTKGKNDSAVADPRAQMRKLQADYDELRLLVLRRPAFNQGLVAAYQKWSSECYMLDALNAMDDAEKRGAAGA